MIDSTTVYSNGDVSSTLPTAAEIEAQVREVVDEINRAKKWPTQGRVDRVLRRRTFVAPSTVLQRLDAQAQPRPTISEALGKACIAALPEMVKRGVVRADRESVHADPAWYIKKQKQRAKKAKEKLDDPAVKQMGPTVFAVYRKLVDLRDNRRKKHGFPDGLVWARPVRLAEMLGMGVHAVERALKILRVDLNLISNSYTQDVQVGNATDPEPRFERHHCRSVYGAITEKMIWCEGQRTQYIKLDGLPPGARKKLAELAKRCPGRGGKRNGADGRGGLTPEEWSAACRERYLRAKGTLKDTEDTHRGGSTTVKEGGELKDLAKVKVRLSQEQEKKRERETERPLARSIAALAFFSLSLLLTRARWVDWTAPPASPAR
jgi:hypothetical protein